MRVLYLVDTLNIGGTEKQMASAALHLQRGGHRVVVGCLREEGPMLKTLGNRSPATAGGSREIVENGKNGVLLPPGSPEKLAEAVLLLLQDSRLAKRLVQAGQNDMQKYFGFDRLIGELKQLYQEPLLS